MNLCVSIGIAMTYNTSCGTEGIAGRSVDCAKMSPWTNYRRGSSQVCLISAMSMCYPQNRLTLSRGDTRRGDGPKRGVRGEGKGRPKTPSKISTRLLEHVHEKSTSSIRVTVLRLTP